MVIFLFCLEKELQIILYIDYLKDLFFFLEEFLCVRRVIHVCLKEPEAETFQFCFSFYFSRLKFI